MRQDDTEAVLPASPTGEQPGPALRVRVIVEVDRGQPCPAPQGRLAGVRPEAPVNSDYWI